MADQPTSEELRAAFYRWLDSGRSNRIDAIAWRIEDGELWGVLNDVTAGDIPLADYVEALEWRDNIVFRIYVWWRGFKRFLGYGA